MRKLLAIFALLLCAQASAQTFPTKPLHIVCAFPPGGPVDVISRSIARELQQQLGQPVVVENRPGASGNIGAEAVAKATPDGYTLLLNWNSLHAISPFLYRKLNYDPNKDLIPLTQLVSFRQVLVVNPGLPAGSVKALIGEAKAHPGKLTFASTGNGTVSHMAGVLFAQSSGIQIVHVPYKGSTPAMTDLIS
jgi:tripartite-type tricarboxylate transporter receptor subunit TctC